MTDCICVNTLSELTTISIPSGTQAAIVNQFNSASDISAAVYVLVNYNPNHPLSRVSQTPGFWWTIHPDHISLEAAGAPPPGGDCSPAMNNVLLYFSAVGRVVLQLWARDYILNSLSALNPAPANAGFSIIGKGPTVSRLVVPHAYNTSGAVSVTFIDPYSQYLLRGFSVISSGATGNTAVNCGTALQMIYPSTQNTSPELGHCGIIEHVRVCPDVDPLSHNGLAYFSTGIDISGTPDPVVLNTEISGCVGPLQKDDYSDTSPRYAMQVCLNISNCYDPHVIASSFQHTTTAVNYNCTFGQVQSFLFDGVEIEGVQTGIYARHVLQCPDGQLRNTFCQFRNIGFDLGNIFKWRITGGTFRVEGSVASAYDIRFIAANVVTVALNTFESGDSGSTAQGRVTIFIDAETQSNGQSGGQNILMDTNVMGDFVRNPQTFATSAIVATRCAQNIRIGASNVFNGPFTGPPVNDTSGQVTTQVGFPTTNNPANPAAVLPNGSIATGLPTLGNGNLNATWLGNFAYGQFMPAIPMGVTLPSVTSGWAIFQDPKGSGKLLASNGSVTVTLANP